MSENCQVCEEEHKATRKCTECDQVFCEVYAEMHSKMKMKKGHTVSQLLPESPSLPSPLPATPAQCETHPTAMNETFCEQCEQPICRFCLQASHARHFHIKLADAYQNRENSFPTLFKNAEELSSELKHKVGTGKEMRNAVDKTHEDISAQITQWYEQMKSLLELHYKRLLNDAKIVATKKKQTLESYVEEAVSCAQKVNSLSTRLQSLHKAGAAEAALLVEYQLRQTMKGLSLEGKSSPLPTDADIWFLPDKNLVQTLEQSIVVDPGISPHHCSVEGDGITQEVSESVAKLPQSDAKFIITLRDYKNQIYKPRSNEIPQCRFEGLDTPTKSIVDNGDGTFTVSYRPVLLKDLKDIKDVKVHILAPHQPIAGSPFSLKLPPIYYTANLSPQELLQLTAWLGKPTTTTVLKLLYKASQDGYSNATFHRLCDHKGPTITIARTSTGYIFGGYASQSWNGALGNYQNAAGCFLFSLSNGKGRAPIQCPIFQNQTHALYHQSGCGPVFGANHDLNFNLDNIGNSYSNVGGTYRGTSGETGNELLAGSYNAWSLTEFEVYLFKR